MGSVGYKKKKIQQKKVAIYYFRQQINCSIRVYVMEK